jgi:hypothetical protein
MVRKGKQAKARNETAGVEDERRTSERESRQVGLLPLPHRYAINPMRSSIDLDLVFVWNL